MQSSQSPPEKKIHKVSSILDLPTCMLVEILSRLPVNSISDCFFVCKAWYDLLSSPYFATAYRKRPPFISLLLFQHKFEGGTFRVYFQLLELQWDYNSCQIDRMKLLKTPANQPKNPVRLFGCCNGLICLSDEAATYDKQYPVYICNPILEEYVKLPQPNMEDYRQAFGFGCHPTTGQYKVLRIIKKLSFNRELLKSKASVFTLGVDRTWRDVGDAPFPKGDHQGFCKIPLNGALHWLVQIPVNLDLIYSFDIKEETIRWIPSHPALYKTNGHNILGVLRNCLCVFSHIYSPEDTVIWCMRKYGVVESWTKEIIINRSNRLSSEVKSLPVATWRDGEILMHDSYGFHPLLSYDPKEKTINSIVSYKGYQTHIVIPFVTSHVQLKNVFKDGHLEVIKND